MTENDIFADLERIKTNMIKLQKRNEELEAENAKLTSAVAWQKETIAARDATINHVRDIMCAWDSELDYLNGESTLMFNHPNVESSVSRMRERCDKLEKIVLPKE